MATSSFARPALVHMRSVAAVLLLAIVPACATPVLVGGPASGTPATSSSGAAAEVVSITNDARARSGLRALAVSARLTEAARLHAEQMASYQQLAHTISGARYPTMQSRLEAVGYVYAGAAENVAWNQRGAQEVMSTWLNSSGHRANIMDPNLTEIGVAVARSAKGEPYWVQVFGRPRN